MGASPSTTVPRAAGGTGFTLLAHADWSVDPRKRWTTVAERGASGWRVAAPQPVGEPSGFRGTLEAAATRGAVLAGFDFPIGVPTAYGARTGLADFRALLAALDSPRWREFHKVADRASEIRLERPFYPAVARKGTRRTTLAEAHGVARFEDLLRICERPTAVRRAACALFWTLGGNQVGKAALDGWRTIVRPLVAEGCALWPFDGPLASLAAAGGVTLAEAYPAEIYGHLGVALGRGGKRSQDARRVQAGAIRAWARDHGVSLDPACADQVETGFGADAAGEDRFDAFIGCLGLIETVDSPRPEARPDDAACLRWEGWILGQAIPPALASPQCGLPAPA